jgi:hypothetical protein
MQVPQALASLEVNTHPVSRRSMSVNKPSLMPILQPGKMRERGACLDFIKTACRSLPRHAITYFV